MCWIDQPEPFHRSTNAEDLPFSPGFVISVPTAVHAIAEVHDTPESAPPTEPGSLGVGRADQLPSHRSANVFGSAKPAWTSPTAMQNRTDGHDTAFNSPFLGRSCCSLQRETPAAFAPAGPRHITITSGTLPTASHTQAETSLPLLRDLINGSYAPGVARSAQTL